MELAAKAVGRLALASGSFTADYIEDLVKRSFEWLQGDRVETRRYAAVLVLHELALSVPTYFFQQVLILFYILLFYYDKQYINNYQDLYNSIFQQKKIFNNKKFKTIVTVTCILFVYIINLI